MKTNRILALLPVACILMSCGQPEYPVNIPFEIVYPEKKDLTESRLNKTSIDNIYIDKTDDGCLLIVDYNFMAFLSDKPNSFNDVFQDSVFIDNVSIEKYHGDIEGAQAQCDTDVLSMQHAHVLSGFMIDPADVGSGKTFTLFLYWDALKMFEITGTI